MKLTEKQFKHYIENTKNTKKTKLVQMKETDTGKNTFLLVEQRLVLI